MLHAVHEVSVGVVVPGVAVHWVGVPGTLSPYRRISFPHRATRTFKFIYRRSLPSLFGPSPYTPPSSFVGACSSST